MKYVSGYVNLFLLLIIIGLGQNDMQSASYVIPAVISVIIGWWAIIRSKKKRQKD